MKILIFPIILAILGGFLYAAFFRKKSHKKTGYPSRNIWILGVVLTAGILIIFMDKFYLSLIQPDPQCLFPHTTASHPPTHLISAVDFFNLGNYDYDIGNCRQAIKDYSKSIALNPAQSEAYNNRAYTYMRLQDYEDAVPDLDKAIALRPDYVSALMNRGDIHNFYYDINRKKALADYNKVIALGATKGNSVCGHKAMALNNNVLPLALLRIFTEINCR